LALLLEHQEVALSLIAPLFENDVILSLTAIGAANYALSQGPAKQQIVRTATHAVTLLGVERIRALSQKMTICDAADASFGSLNYRFILAQTQFLDYIVSCLIGRSHQLNDARLLVYALQLPALHWCQAGGSQFNIAQAVKSHYSVNFWQVEHKLAGVYLLDEITPIMQQWSFPPHIQTLFASFPGVEFFIIQTQNSTSSIDPQRVNQWLKSAYQAQNKLLPIVVLSYFLLHYAPTFWGDRSCRLALRWLARFTGNSYASVRRVLSQCFITYARDFQLFKAYGQCLLNQNEAPALSLHELSQAIEKIQSHANMNCAPRRIALVASKKLNLPKPQTLIQPYFTDFEDWHNNESNASWPMNDRLPTQVIEDFKQQLATPNNVYNSPTALCATLIHTLRVGLAAGGCVAILQEPGKDFYTASTSGLPPHHPLGKLRINSAEGGVLNHFMQQPRALWLKPDNAKSIIPTLPQLIQAAIADNEALLTSLINANNTPIGIVIIIAKNKKHRFNPALYKAFQSLVLTARLSLA